ncbi:MAG: TolC family protein [Campylobacterota bacterium]|nr:TolC family protein [Campylobacterota bacterium]
MKFLFLIIPVFIYAESLKSLLDFANKNSDVVISKELVQKSKAKDLESKENSFYPTIDVGAFYQTQNEKSFMMAGDVYSTYAKLSYDIYDGGGKSSQLSQTKHEYKASGFDYEATKKSLALQIVEDFFSIKSLKASLEAKEKASKSLEKQLIRVKRFYQAKITTKDSVDRLQSAYDTNIYEIESLKFDTLCLNSSLELKVGKRVTSFDDSKFKKFSELDIELSDSVKFLMAKKDALVSSAESIDSIYYPQIRIEDSFNLYAYDRTDQTHLAGVDKQNKLILSLNMRVFDMGTIAKTKESILINSQALSAQVVYNKKGQKLEYDLALLRIKTNEIKIKSASSALVSATSAFKTISKKYDARIVDNIVYLDALTSLTSAKTLYERSLNDLQIAYARYYFYAGKNIEEFLQ